MAKFDVDDALIRKLAGLLEETGLTELEYRFGEQSVRVSRAATGVVASTGPQVLPSLPEETKPAGGPHPGAVTAPMVGVVYLAPEPGSPPFVKAGDMVAEGQTLLLIEAMKTFNPVRAPRAGRVTSVLVADKTPVEFGEELVILE